MDLTSEDEGGEKTVEENRKEVKELIESASGEKDEEELEDLQKRLVDSIEEIKEVRRRMSGSADVKWEKKKKKLENEGKLKEIIENRKREFYERAEKIDKELEKLQEEVREVERMVGERRERKRREREQRERERREREWQEREKTKIGRVVEAHGGELIEVKVVQQGSMVRYLCSVRSMRIEEQYKGPDLVGIGLQKRLLNPMPPNMRCQGPDLVQLSVMLGKPLKCDNKVVKCKCTGCLWWDTRDDGAFTFFDASREKKRDLVYFIGGKEKEPLCTLKNAVFLNLLLVEGDFVIPRSGGDDLYYKGEFLNGMPGSRGEMRKMLEDGTVISGSCLDGKMEGVCSVISPKGEITIGTFEKGVETRQSFTSRVGTYRKLLGILTLQRLKQINSNTEENTKDDKNKNFPW
jgi:hypothetical protein